MRTASMPSFRRVLWVILPSVVAIALTALPAKHTIIIVAGDTK